MKAIGSGGGHRRRAQLLCAASPRVPLSFEGRLGRSADVQPEGGVSLSVRAEPARIGNQPRGRRPRSVEKPIAGNAAAALAAALWLAAAASADAARIGDLAETNWREQAVEFVTLGNARVLWAVAGCAMLGLCCGLLGGFVVVRRMALMGDALAHAVFPGVMVGFLVTMKKDPAAIFAGAVGAGLLGAAVVRLIRETTRLKDDAALGIVLGGFYAVGATLLAMTQRIPTAARSGIDTFLFGQAAMFTPGSVALVGAVTAVSIGAAVLFYRPFFAISFDPGFARSIGIPHRFFHYFMMLLLAFAVVAAIQAVGVVLVSALLIIPASAAYLTTSRLPAMLAVSSGLGAAAAVGGAFVSYLGANLPTGPFIVLTAALMFGAAFLLAPAHGMAPRWARRRRRAARIGRENTLKAIYHLVEDRGFAGRKVELGQLARRRGVSEAAAGAEVRRLAVRGLARRAGADVTITRRGWARAGEVVRSHRLWERYLTDEADIAPDHVHDSAEQIEHVLGPSTIEKIERAVSDPTLDPHGRAIPAAAEPEDAAAEPEPIDSRSHG